MEKERTLLTFFVLLLCFCYPISINGETKEPIYTIEGQFLDSKTKEPLPFAIITSENNQDWATADKNGFFKLSNIHSGEQILTTHLLGYNAKNIQLNVSHPITGFKIYLDAVSLKLNEVCIIADAKNKKSGASSSYTIDRTAMEHLQATNITDVMSLLPGGKFHGDKNLTNTNANFEVRGNKYEMNSTSFSTAVEVDGIRLNNNASYGNLQGIDNRSISVGNVESVEVITGIPSVEYGDLNSGMVKIKTSKGRTPLVIEMVTKPHTKMLSVRKGFVIGNGTLNASFERAKSISDIISPYTSYDRNGVTLSYSQRLNSTSEKPLFLDAGFSGNIGGYDSKRDPDQLGESYQEVEDNGLRANIGLNWNVNSKLLSNVTWNASMTYSSKLKTDNNLITKSASDAAIHTYENGYFVTEDYDQNPSADIIMLKPGHYYELGYYDDKPLYFSTKLKADSKINFGERLFNRVMLGTEYSYAINKGKGKYYDDMRLAPTWREYQLKDNPGMHNVAIFLEDNLDIKTTASSRLKLMAGVRSDMTLIKGSEYGTVCALSPRLNARYIFWENKEQLVSDLEAHIGWGKAVKLPSFNILYPRPEYLDLPIFTTTNNESNIAYSAYKTQVNHMTYNKDLKWQSNQQIEIGANATIAGIDMGVMFYRNVIHDTYTQQTSYLPFSYNYTGPASLEGVAIPEANRSFTIDRTTGVVTVSDRTGKLPSQALKYTTYNRFITNEQCINGSPVERMGVEYYFNFPKIPAIQTEIRLDGNYYHYKGLNEIINQSHPGMYANMSNGEPYKYIGHFIGSASPVNGSITEEANMNLMFTTHIPKIRLICSLRLEATLYNQSQSLSEWSQGNRSYNLKDREDYIGTDPDIYKGGSYTVTYPQYYSTWEDPDTKIPFMEKFLWAKNNDPALFNDLAQLVQRSTFPYQFNPLKVSPYYSVNINITKEIGDVASVSFYALNFLNNMQKIKTTQGVEQEGSIYNSSYIPKFYYGLSVRLKF